MRAALLVSLGTACLHAGQRSVHSHIHARSWRQCSGGSKRLVTTAGKGSLGSALIGCYALFEFSGLAFSDHLAKRLACSGRDNIRVKAVSPDIVVDCQQLLMTDTSEHLAPGGYSRHEVGACLFVAWGAMAACGAAKRANSIRPQGLWFRCIHICSQPLSRPSSSGWQPYNN